MEDIIRHEIRRIIKEEIKASTSEHPFRARASTTPPPRIEMPLRPGEIERHYPVSEVARLLGMSRVWVYERLNDGTFIAANFGDGKSKKRIPASSVNAFIAAHTY